MGIGDRAYMRSTGAPRTPISLTAWAVGILVGADTVHVEPPRGEPRAQADDALPLDHPARREVHEHVRRQRRHRAADGRRRALGRRRRHEHVDVAESVAVHVGKVGVAVAQARVVLFREAVAVFVGVVVVSPSR